MEQDKRAAATLRLLKIMDELREKCPWDRKQTFETLRGNTIEETYELADAILDRNMEGIREELGDLMLHIVFYSKLGAEAGAFDYADVVDGLCDKLIYRHPHVYGDIHADTPDDVLQAAAHGLDLLERLHLQTDVREDSRHRLGRQVGGDVLFQPVVRDIHIVSNFLSDEI